MERRCRSHGRPQRCDAPVYASLFFRLQSSLWLRSTPGATPASTGTRCVVATDAASGGGNANLLSVGSMRIPSSVGWRGSAARRFRSDLANAEPRTEAQCKHQDIKMQRTSKIMFVLVQFWQLASQPPSFVRYAHWHNAHIIAHTDHITLSTCFTPYCHSERTTAINSTRFYIAEPDC